MSLSQALNTVYKFTPKEFPALSELQSPELIDQYLDDSGIVTLRKRHLPMEMMVRAVTEMTLFRSLSISQLVSLLNILLPLFCYWHGFSGLSAAVRPRSSRTCSKKYASSGL